MYMYITDKQKPFKPLIQQKVLNEIVCTIKEKEHYQLQYKHTHFPCLPKKKKISMKKNCIHFTRKWCKLTTGTGDT